MIKLKKPYTTPTGRKVKLVAEEAVLGVCKNETAAGPTYMVWDSKLELIKRLTEGGDVDYVIIGNNRGAGVSKASKVAQNMRANHACVVWHDYIPGYEQLYAKLGYKYFMSRNVLEAHLIKHITEKHLKP